MENQFNKQDFEKLLREHANQYRMYPSEKVWSGIHSVLHSRRKWYSISALALLLISVTVISLLTVNNSVKNDTVANLNADSPVLNTQVESGNQLPDNIYQAFQSPKDNSQRHRTYFDYKKQLSDPVEISDFSVENNLITGYSEFSSETLDEEAGDNLRTQSTSLEIIPVNIKADGLSKDQTIVTESKLSDAINALASYNAPSISKVLQSKLSAEFYITPTISYRKLSENKNQITNSYSYSSQFIDLNNVVNHKPALGFEFGVEGKYRLNNQISLKTGFQFNINRYDIQAYPHSTEIATVAYNSGYRTSYLSTLSNYRNVSNTSPNWLENFYFQTAIPVGVEFILAEKKNFSWGISGTVQPTYLIGDRAYMISSDYKNYAKFPDLMRRWNLSSGFETFVSYSTGRVKWETGPHIRYQHLSSFVGGYPVKENLFAVGLKVAATFNKK